MSDTTQWLRYGAYCPRCERGFQQKHPPGIGTPIWIRCVECDTATPAYRNTTPEMVRKNRTNGTQNNPNR